MLKFAFLIILLANIDSLLCVNRENDPNTERQLIANRRSFIRFLDEEKLISYLSSFGSNPSAEESRQHMVYKRASGRVKKIKKNLSTEAPIKQEIEKQKKGNVRQERQQAAQNFTISPKQMIKFELEDAKYDEAYEKLRKNRKLRVKRSADDEKNSTVGEKNFRMEKFIGKDTFIQPKEVLKFVYSDAVTFSPISSNNADNKENKEKKSKRETSSTDSSISETRKIKITHPLSSSSRTKHVMYEELPKKVQKIVESAINDAVLKGKASDGDYLKFYYGDKIFKVPVSLSKYISTFKESTPKGLSDYHTYKPEKFQKEDVVTESKVKGLYSKYQSIINHSLKPEKAESYANIITPKYKSELKVEEIEPVKIQDSKKSIYYYSSTDDLPKTSLGPVNFEIDTSPKLSGNYFYGNKILHTPSPKEDREIIPITEDFNESKLSIPAIAIHPTSYVEYEDAHTKKYLNPHEEKNYAFGYHVSDYKSGNNFGHSQMKNNKEIKGEYSILLPDGRIQLTKYFADDSGFHADVSYQNIH